jgi:beta-ureidopropionase / N-carbamoyl-L-amino-acid hydrolase
VYGIERHRVRFEGRAAHAGSTPMAARRDALAAAAHFVLAVRESAVQRGGVATVGSVRISPGIATAIPGSAELVLDQRHAEAEALASMLDDARRAADAAGAEQRVSASWTAIQSVAPVAFDARLVEAADECARATAGETMRLPSGALHDAVMVARAGVPTVMVFVQSLGGISHNRLEDSRREDIELGVAAVDRLVRRLAG